MNQAHLCVSKSPVTCCACCVDRPADSLPDDIDALRALASTAIAERDAAIAERDRLIELNDRLPVAQGAGLRG